MAAFRTLWTALVDLYDETLVLVGGNFSAVALNVPIGIVLLGIVLPFTPIARILGFVPMPLPFFGFLAAATITYLALVELCGVPGGVSSGVKGKVVPVIRRE